MISFEIGWIAGHGHVRRHAQGHAQLRGNSLTSNFSNSCILPEHFDKEKTYKMGVLCQLSSTLIINSIFRRIRATTAPPRVDHLTIPTTLRPAPPPKWSSLCREDSCSTDATTILSVGLGYLTVPTNRSLLIEKICSLWKQLVFAIFATRIGSSGIPTKNNREVSIGSAVS